MAGKAKKGLRDSDSDVFVPDEREVSAFARWVLRPAVLLAIVGGISLYIAGPVAWSWLPDLKRRPEYRLRADKVRFTNPPSWVPPSFIRDVIREAELPEELSLLDDQLVDQVAKAFQKDAWVERVVSVRKDFATGVTAVIEYRKPVAFVVTESEHYPIDREARAPAPAESAARQRRTARHSQRPFHAEGAARSGMGGCCRRGGSQARGNTWSELEETQA